MSTGNLRWTLARALLGVALALGSGLVGCGSTNGGDSSPIPSTGVPEAARGARGVKVADHSTPAPASTDTDPFGGNPFDQPDLSQPPGFVPQPPPPAQPPPDPFGVPPTAPSAAPSPAPLPPPKPPSTGVPL